MKPITYEYFAVDLIKVTIPVTKKHNIKLFINETGARDGSGIYPPEIEICIGDKPVTDAYIKRTPDQTISPTGHNLKTAFALIEEAESRMAERRQINETTTNEE